MLIAMSHLTARSSLPGSFGRLTLIEPPSTPSAHLRESSRKLAGPNIASAMPSSNACGPFSMRLFLSGFEMMTSRAFSMPIRFGSSQAPPQPGDQPEEHLGERQRRCRRVDGAVRGVERDLRAPAEREPVDEHERRDAELGQLAEREVAWELRHQQAGLVSLDLSDPREVGAGREDERLAGDGDAVDLLFAARGPSASITPENSSREPAPSVFGRVWSRPLSSVTSAMTRPLGRGMSRTNECVMTSFGSRSTSR